MSCEFSVVEKTISKRYFIFCLNPLGGVTNHLVDKQMLTLIEINIVWVSSKRVNDYHKN